MIQVEDLTKHYGATTALDRVGFSVPAGTVTGLLGPNGAGKTTTLGILSTLLRPTAGRAVVVGWDVERNPAEVRRRIGLVFQESTLDPELTATQNLRFQAELFGLRRREIPTRITEMLELVGLTSVRDVPAQLLSGGMRRRLEIARGLLHTPRLLFLDEPTTGLDPQTRSAIWEHLHRLRREHEVTIFLTTHYLEEAENCGRIAIMDQGTVAVEGSPSHLKSQVGEDLIELYSEDDTAAADAVRSRFGLEAETAPVGGVRIRVAEGAALVPKLCAELPLPVRSVTVSPPSLDDVFLHYTGRTIRDTEFARQTLDMIGRS